MKKLIAIALALFVAAGSAFAQVDLSKVKDGVYFAQSKTIQTAGKSRFIVEG